MAEMVRITSGALSAAINSFGAELTHLEDAQGRELMTDADPAFWTGHAPLLFPTVGALNGGRYRLEDGRAFAMAQHGFARRSEWVVAARGVDHARFQLSDDAVTRAQYPFGFVLDAEYRLAGLRLDVTVRLRNRGEAPLPASFGFHPAFAWPLPYGAPRESHRLTFAADEEPHVNRVVDALIGARDRPSPLDGRELRLRDDLFAEDALVWEQVESGSVRYGAAEGPALDIAFPGAPSLGVWTRPGARFVCVEPWWGHADPEGFAGTIWEKPGIIRLDPGDERTFAMSVTLVKGNGS